MIGVEPFSQSAGGEIPPMNRPTKSRPEYNRIAHITHTGTFLEHPAQEIKKTAPLGPTEVLLHKATPRRQGVKADLSKHMETNKKRQLKWGDKEPPNKRKGGIPRNKSYMKLRQAIYQT